MKNSVRLFVLFTIVAVNSIPSTSVNVRLLSPNATSQPVPAVLREDPKNCPPPFTLCIIDGDNDSR